MEATPSSDQGKNEHGPRVLKTPRSEHQVSGLYTAQGHHIFIYPECRGKRFWPPGQILEK